MQDPISVIYSAVGADEPFFRLVEAFYQNVESDAVLRPLYPSDLTLPKENLALFLIQRMGGRTTYSDKKGHPRMRGRHMPFKIGQSERDAWLKCMLAAVDTTPELARHKQALEIYFSEFATFLINHPS